MNKLALVLTLMAAAPAASSWAKSPVAATVTDIKGRPQVKGQGQSFRSLRRQDSVYEGDVIKTGSGELAALAFLGGVELRINANSNFTVQSGGRGQEPPSVFTTLGQAWTRLLHGKGGGMQVRTPVAVCSVRGTEADVEMGERMMVKVYEGLVDVANDKGAQSLRAGQLTQVASADSAPQAPKSMDQGDYGTWQNSLKPEDTAKAMERLNREAAKNRTLELEMDDKDGKKKKIKLNFEKK
ncbi:MAG: hypothetical protein A3J74_07515 [Elusimicrobia bacterium RIFCSPHIGHO2_02_FULL_57_9]|nr:MAG: hypothetical protein A3J74_07515 [Elusimicrobia bacterium RIFCSPHIGHO2_02_FULL_57_9]